MYVAHSNDDGADNSRIQNHHSSSNNDNNDNGKDNNNNYHNNYDNDVPPQTFSFSTSSQSVLRPLSLSLSISNTILSPILENLISPISPISFPFLVSENFVTVSSPHLILEEKNSVGNEEEYRKEEMLGKLEDENEEKKEQGTETGLDFNYEKSSREKVEKEGKDRGRGGSEKKVELCNQYNAAVKEQIIITRYFCFYYFEICLSNIASCHYHI